MKMSRKTILITITSLLTGLLYIDVTVLIAINIAISNNSIDSPVANEPNNSPEAQSDSTEQAEGIKNTNDTPAVNESSELFDEFDFWSQLNDFYWYLDGAQYAYIHPIVSGQDGKVVINWYDAEHINLDAHRICAEEYNRKECPTNFATLSFAQPKDIRDKYKVRINGNKLYLTVNNNEYSFTGYREKKPIQLILEGLPDKISLHYNERKSYTSIVEPIFAITTITKPSIEYNLSGDKDCIQFTQSINHTQNDKSTVYAFGVQSIHNNNCSATINLSAPLYNWAKQIKVNVNQ